MSYWNLTTFHMVWNLRVYLGILFLKMTTTVQGLPTLKIGAGSPGTASKKYYVWGWSSKIMPMGRLWFSGADYQDEPGMLSALHC